MGDAWEHDGDDETAVDEACARLGWPRQWLAVDGHEHTIIAGAVDARRVVWVERRFRGDPTWDDVEYTLWVAVDGALTLAWTVETYNPYFGCEVGFLRLGADEVVVVYREKHRTIVASLALAGGATMRALADRWRVVGDELLWESRVSRGLVERVRLPDLAWGLPLPGGLCDALLAAGTPLPCPGPHTGSDPATMQSAIVRRLFGAEPPAPLAGLVVGALAHSFWDAAPVCGSRYDSLTIGPGEWNQLGWLPFHWHHTLGPAEAEALVAALVELAARPPAEPDADLHGWRIELACRHVAERCAELAAVCRAGRLPEGVSCYFWVEWSQAGFAAVERQRFPADLWRVWESLRPHAERLRALTGR